MGFSDAVGDIHAPMSSAQRSMIVSLMEQYDGMRPGSYADFDIRSYKKHEASREIERLQRKIESKRTGK